MVAIYDRVLPSGSAAALAALTGLVGALHAACAVLEAIRARILCRAGLDHVERLDGHVLAALQAQGDDRCFALLDDVERVRRFLTSAGPCAAFDVLWLPAFLVAVFLVHPALGLFACAGTLMLSGLAVSAESRERETRDGILLVRRDRYALARDLRTTPLPDGHVRCPDPTRRWNALSRSYSEVTFSAQTRALPAVALGKGLRLMLQSAGVGIGALLAIEGLLSPGALFASSLMLGRTFACLDGALAHWRGFAEARESHLRLSAMLSGPHRQ